LYKKTFERKKPLWDYEGPCIHQGFPVKEEKALLSYWTSETADNIRTKLVIGRQKK